MNTFLKTKQTKISAKQEQNYTIEEYLNLCKTNPEVYATAAQRMLKAIGEKQIIDTAKDKRLSRIFANRTIATYPAFADFYGMEETIEQIVKYYDKSSQGLEESKQILYLLGPVGGGKSSLAERLKNIYESQPFYVLTYKGTISPVFEKPFVLFDKSDAVELQSQYGIPSRLINGFQSPWCVKRVQESMEEHGGEINFEDFGVRKIWPSRLRQIGIAKVEPGDENNQDISTMVGKVDIRKLEKFSQNDPDAYSYSGGLNRTTQGLLEFVEMFKAPIKMLHPLLTATQEGNYIGTENIGAIPFDGLILAHSNEAEWQQFRNNKNNEAFIDRVVLIRVPYCLRVTEEQKIFQKLIDNSELKDDHCAPATLEMLARFSVLSRIDKKGTAGTNQLFSKMRIYDGETLKDTDPNAHTLQQYKDMADKNEGLRGVISTRFCYKVLSDTYNFDIHERAADPVHLMYVLETHIRKEQFPKEEEDRLLEIIKEILARKYVEFIGEEIQKAYIESYSDFGQNVFDRYIAWADAWIEDQDFKDPDTGQLMNREALEQELSKIEKPANIGNTKDFRNEVVKFTLRARASNGGKNPSWTSYEKIREVIEKRMFGQIEELLPVISFGSKKDGETEKKHEGFVERMKAKGYTDRQIRRLTEWYIRCKQAS